MWPKLWVNNCIKWPQLYFHSSKQYRGGTSRRAKCHCWFEASATAEAEVRSVWVECVEHAEGCRSELCGEAPKSLFISPSHMQKKRLTRRRARGVEIKATWKSRQKSMQAHEKSNTVEGITSQFFFPHYFPNQLSQFIWSACWGKTVLLCDNWSTKDFQPATDMYTNTAAVVPFGDWVS